MPAPISPRANSRRFGIVASRFNQEISQRLLEGALATLQSKGVAASRVDVKWVAGAFELPVAALKMAQSKKYQAIVAVGCILEGETPHYKYLSQATLNGLITAGLLTGVPVSSGVVTAQSWKKALERSKAKGLNRGKEATLAALQSVKAFS